MIGEGNTGEILIRTVSILPDGSITTWNKTIPNSPFVEYFVGVVEESSDIGGNVGYWIMRVGYSVLAAYFYVGVVPVCEFDVTDSGLSICI